MATADAGAPSSAPIPQDSVLDHVEQANRFYNLFRTMVQGVVYLDADGRVTLANPAAEAIFCMPFDQLSGLESVDPRWKTVREDGSEFPPDEHPTMVALRTGRKVTGVVMGITPPNDYEQRWVQVDAIPEYRAGESKPHQAFVTLHDITERKRVEQALLASEEKYRRLATELEQRVRERTAEVQELYDNAATGYHSIDANGNIILMNQTELNWLGYVRDEVIGQPAINFLSGTVVANWDDEFEAFKQRGSLRDVEFEFRRKDGTVFPVLITSRAIYNEQGRYVMSRATAFDNTERKAAADALVRANWELERAMRTKDEFLANMSHDLRTPLTGILAVAEVLREQIYGPLTERQQKAVQSLEASARHQLDLVNDLLDLAKIDGGRLELFPEFVSVDELCQASLTFVRELAFKKQLRLLYESNCHAIGLKVDPKRLKQMLVNLLSNAVKFTPEGGKVTLRVVADADHGTIEFSVQDTGIGVDQADLSKLFQPFAQLNPASARQNEGTGLGLALVKRLARQHGGDVHVQSSGPGQGSCFTITLPYTPIAGGETKLSEAGSLASTLAVVPNMPSASSTEPPWVLLADDNELNSQATGEYLQHCGYHVVLASNGPEALAAAVAMHFAVILMDIQMPMMDGLEVIRRLRRNPHFASTPIIALTALALPGDRERCLEAGATAYISKPIPLPVLAETIARYLRP